MRFGLRQLLVIVSGLWMGSLLASEASDVVALIQKLGSSRFADREAAGKALENLGVKAVPELRKAKDSPNPEVRGRARILLRQIEKALEGSRYAGAFQFKVLPDRKNRSAVRLEITSKAPVAVQELLSCRIDTAVTDKGQDLAALVKLQSQKADAHSFSIPLPPGKWKLVKEIRGTITARIEANVSVEVGDILKSAGKTARGQGEEIIKILAVRERQAEDVLDVHLQLENFEPDDNDQVPPAMRVRPGVVVLLGPEDIAASRLNLLDAKGTPCRRLSYTSRVVPGKPVVDMRLLYRPPPGPGGPLRLLYEHQPSILVDIPFTIRDVPLQ